MIKKKFSLIMNMNNLKIIIVLSAVLGVLGCYTSFSRYNKDIVSEMPEDGQPQVVVDSVGDSVRVIYDKDTVFVKEREICLWERTFTGGMRLRCYPDWYSSGYHRYSSYPWWLRDHFYYDDYYDSHYLTRGYYYNGYYYPYYYSGYPYYYPGGSSGGSSSDTQENGRKGFVPGSTRRGGSSSDIRNENYESGKRNYIIVPDSNDKNTADGIQKSSNNSSDVNRVISEPDRNTNSSDEKGKGTIIRKKKPSSDDNNRRDRRRR